MSLEVGAVLEGKVTGITKFGAFVSLGNNKSGLVHVSEISTEYVADINNFLAVGQTVKVKVIGIDDKNRINLSIKRVQTEAAKQETPPAVHTVPSVYTDHADNKQMSFEDMMSRFKKISDDKLSDLGDSKEYRKANYAKRSHK